MVPYGVCNKPAEPRPSKPWADANDAFDYRFLYSALEGKRNNLEAEAGYNQAQISDMRERGVIGGRASEAASTARPG